MTCMRFAVFVCTLAVTCMCFAQLGASATTNRIYTSETITENAWERDVVMRREPTGEIFNDRGKVGSAAEVSAANEVADGAASMAEAAHDSMTNQLRRLEAAAASTASNSLAIALVVRPETSRTNLTFYVVQTETDGYTDTQWVWCNWDLAMAPNRFVVYETFGKCSTNKFNWTDWNVKTNVTVNGRTWNGCRRGTVTRPDWAAGGSCLDLPNDRLGGASGFDFGDLTITVGGRTPYTGFVTNGVTGEVLYFDQGINKGNPEEGL